MGLFITINFIIIFSYFIFTFYMMKRGNFFERDYETYTYDNYINYNFGDEYIIEDTKNERKDYKNKTAPDKISKKEDRCDRCGGLGNKILILKSQLKLTLCRKCFNLHQEKLSADGVEVISIP